jgi:DNA-binding NarL/FixJ family response regulator
MIKVFIIDDHPSIIAGLKTMLQNSEDIVVVGSFDKGKDLLEALENNVPDVLLLDIHLPDIAGNRLARIISSKYPQLAILAFTNMNTDFHVHDMMKNGCLGYVLKTADAHTIIQGIKEVYQGKQFIIHPMKEDIQYEMMQSVKQATKLPSLTKRENEILAHICNGFTNQKIAEKLSLSIRTIENHRFNLSQKLQVKSTADLIKKALHLGLV